MAQSTYNVLSIDGGGIRGVIPAVFLATMAEIIERKHGQSLTEYFQMISGTSTGAILAAGLATEIDVSKMQHLYANLGREVFPYQHRWSFERISLWFQYGLSAPKYSAAPLEKLLKEVIGAETLGEVNDRVRLLVPFYDTKARSTEFFKSYAATASGTLEFGDVPLWEVALCSSSAPTFFPAHRLEANGRIYSAIDGGVAANNPVACALADAAKEAGSLDSIRIVSLGTGASTRGIPLSDAQEWGALEWAIPLVDVFMDASGDVSRYIAQSLVGQQNLMRLQFALDSEKWGVKPLSDDMDDASPENIRSLRVAAEKYLEQGAQDKLERFL